MVMNFSVYACAQWALIVWHSVAVEIVVNGVLRTLWVMPYRGVSMGYMCMD